jgi:hypothetical protein
VPLHAAQAAALRARQRALCVGLRRNALAAVSIALGQPLEPDLGEKEEVLLAVRGFSILRRGTLKRPFSPVRRK